MRLEMRQVLRVESRSSRVAWRTDSVGRTASRPFCSVVPGTARESVRFTHCREGTAGERPGIRCAARGRYCEVARRQRRAGKPVHGAATGRRHSTRPTEEPVRLTEERQDGSGAETGNSVRGAAAGGTPSGVDRRPVPGGVGGETVAAELRSRPTRRVRGAAARPGGRPGRAVSERGRSLPRGSVAAFPVIRETRSRFRSRFRVRLCGGDIPRRGRAGRERSAAVAGDA